VNLKRHLARLAQGSLAEPTSAPRVSAEDALAELRRKMNEILEREAAPSSVPLQMSSQEPPPFTARDFAALDDLVTEVESEHGRYFVRKKVLGITAQVGQQALASPASIDPGILALLALSPALAGVNYEKALFLDTETTGLGTGAGVIPFLVGLGWFENGRFRVEQSLLAAPEQEAAMLRALAELVRKAEVLVTFNGKSFDWPLLESRFVMNRLPVPQAPPHLDLLHVARRIHKQRLGRCNLKAIETHVLGFERIDDIDGAEVASRYIHYLHSGSSVGLRPVVEHNYLDVVGMAALVSLYGDASLTVAERDPFGVARTLRRAQAYDLAASVCGRAIAAGGGAEIYGVRAEIHRALGDRPRVIADLEMAGDTPHVRLQLAKLYEHFLRRPELALDMAARGTAEMPEQAARRRLRLTSKLASNVGAELPQGVRPRRGRPTGPKVGV